MPKVFELVAGEGDDFMATDAPSGSEAGQAETGETLFTAPESVKEWTPPAPVVEAEPEPAPVTPVAPTVTKVEPVKPVVKEQPVPNFTKIVERRIDRAEAKTKKEIEKMRAATARAEKEKALADKRMSHAEFLKSQGGKTTAAQRQPSGGTTTGPRVDASGIKKGITGATGAGSKGAGGKELSAAEGKRMERYFAMLIQRLRESHEKPGGLSDLLNAEVQFMVAANGSLSAVRIVRSSGNADFDQSVLEAFARVRMPARPDGKSDVQSLTFRIKEA
jgi:colicin import membrane protein